MNMNQVDLSAMLERNPGKQMPDISLCCDTLVGYMSTSESRRTAIGVIRYLSAPTKETNC
jgi:hypothetical protein